MSIEGGYGPDEGAGWSGSDTSREAGEKTERLGKRQQEVMDLLTGELEGMTCAEVEWSLAVGHGAASGALTRLHRAGKVVRLVERRGGQQVYITPDYVRDRETAPYVANRVNRNPDEMGWRDVLTLLDDAGLDLGSHMTPGNVKRLLKEAWK